MATVIRSKWAALSVIGPVLLKPQRLLYAFTCCGIKVSEIYNKSRSTKQSVANLAEVKR